MTYLGFPLTSLLILVKSSFVIMFGSLFGLFFGTFRILVVVQIEHFIIVNTHIETVFWADWVKDAVVGVCPICSIFSCWGWQLTDRLATLSHINYAGVVIFTTYCHIIQNKPTTLFRTTSYCPTFSQVFFSVGENRILLQQLRWDSEGWQLLTCLSCRYYPDIRHT